MIATTLSLLSDDEPPPVRLHHGDRGAIVLVCEHAGRRTPGALGLGEPDLVRHIAWDIGAAGWATVLAERLDAPLFTQTYSRLVCDCNRRTDILVTDNEPCLMDDVNDCTVPHHGERRGLPCLEIEVRQDLIAGPAGQLGWAERLAPILRAAVTDLERSA